MCRPHMWFVLRVEWGAGTPTGGREGGQWHPGEGDTSQSEPVGRRSGEVSSRPRKVGIWRRADAPIPAVSRRSIAWADGIRALAGEENALKSQWAQGGPGGHVQYEVWQYQLSTDPSPTEPYSPAPAAHTC